MLTYNAFLYTERNKRGLSRKEMAEALKISKFKYSLIENGYLKPNLLLTQRISEFLELDYTEYTHKEASYPAELPEKTKSKFVQFLYKMVGHIAFKITFISLSVLMIGFTISGFIVNNNVYDHRRDYYAAEYCQFVDNLRETGSFSYSMTNTLTRPEYRSFTKDGSGNSKYVSIIGDYSDKSIEKLNLKVVHRSGDTKLTYFVYTFAAGADNFTMTIDYEDFANTFSLTAYYSKGKFSRLTTNDAQGNKGYPKESDEKYNEYITILSSKMDTFASDIDALISEKDPTFAPEIAEKAKLLNKYLNEGNAKVNGVSIYSFIARYLGIVLSGLCVFITVFGFLYGTRKGVVVNYRPTQLEVPVDEVHRMKTDFHISPFIPETVLEFLGIILVFLGSLRVIVYGMGFANGTLGQIITNQVSINYANLFMIGMFLLYFMDFDIFLDDKRVFRNIFLYLIVFICLYALENLLYRSINSGSIVGTFAATLKLPNMFSSIACYYFIMLFLFYTPQRIKKKSTLIIYRCCSIIPVGVIIAFWILYNGYNVLFTADWPLEVRNLFNGEKFPFSILAMTYLFSLFFLRLFFERKYGKEKATVFFNGNRFLWIKNILIVSIIIIIGVVELILKDNSVANKLGLGRYYIIFILIPFLAFYHPHKGPRNTPLDWTTLGLYLIAVLIAYVATALLFIINLQ